MADRLRVHSKERWQLCGGLRLNVFHVRVQPLE